jgi:hypothetical protein
MLGEDQTNLAHGQSAIGGAAGAKPYRKPCVASPAQMLTPGSTTVDMDYSNPEFASKRNSSALFSYESRNYPDGTRHETRVEYRNNRDTYCGGDPGGWKNLLP